MHRKIPVTGGGGGGAVTNHEIMLEHFKVFRGIYKTIRLQC